MQILNTDLAKNGDITTLGAWKEGEMCTGGGVQESNRKCLKLKMLKIAILFRSTDINHRRNRWRC